ncbi:MAG: protein-glutamate O-methyltransferase CheR [Myxococcota bacterium]|nr:protein-glutamate O-methyltransferase CheR [Myxococcales bacterium]
MAETAATTMTDAQFRLLCDVVRAHAGLHFDEGTRYLVEKRVARRMQAVGATSLSAYLWSLRSPGPGSEELVALVDELTTNETYFFREIRQLRALVDEIVPERLVAGGARRGRGPVQIWSAGCASGEEPYSIVMLALEAGLVPGRDLHVYASDIAPSVLTKARRGHYRPASFRETPDPLRDKYFVEKDGLFRIRDEVRACVDFIHLNLLDPSKIALLGAMDVILCRNVIIYFDAATKKRVIDTFYERLVPGGYLLLGHSESLITVSTAFELCHLRSDLVYRRPIPGEERDDPWHRIAAHAAAAVDGGPEGGR